MFGAHLAYQRHGTEHPPYLDLYDRVRGPLAYALKLGTITRLIDSPNRPPS